MCIENKILFKRILQSITEITWEPMIIRRTGFPPLCLIFDCRVDKLHFAEYRNVLYKADEKVGGLTGPT